MKKNIVLIDYGSGNLRSAAKAIEHVAGAAATVTISNQAAALKQATHVVLPGVGAFADCYQGLLAIAGLQEALQENVFLLKKPFLGICVGMQLLATIGYENGTHQGLDWISGSVEKITGLPPSCKIPHMGWNTLEINPAQAAHPILSGINNGDFVYFVHSYHFIAKNPAVVAAHTTYGEKPLSALLVQDNIIGTQFHPEKSQAVGLRLLQNFLQL